MTYDHETIDCKSALRAKFADLRLGLDESYMSRSSSEICKFIRSISEIRDEDLLAAFYPMKGEPDILPFLSGWISSRRKLLFPRFDKSSKSYGMACVDKLSDGFSPGKFGIPEPGGQFPDADTGLKKSVSWLVPGLVFDRKGNRIGHGCGVFDLLLSDAEGLKIGICFEKQITDSVPVEKSDVKMDFIVTETGVRTCRNGGI